MPVDIGALKRRQDALDARTPLLMDQTAAVHKGLLGQFRTFAETAEKAGIRGVQSYPLRPARGGGASHEYLLNNYHIEIVTFLETALEPQNKDRLSTHTPIYVNENDAHRLIWDIVVIEWDGDYRIFVHVDSPSGLILFADRKTATEADGASIGDLLLGQIYKYERVWRDIIDYDTALSGARDRYARPMGFPISDE